MHRIAILIQPELEWPVIVGVDAPPGASVGRHWPDYPEVTGLPDADGNPLLAVNEQGMFAAVVLTGGDGIGKRDPHELVLDLLDNPDATDAALALRDLDARAYGLFTLAIGDNRDCHVAGNWQDEAVQIDDLAPGLTTLGPGQWNLPDALQPGSSLWDQQAEKVMVALPGVVLFGSRPQWHPTSSIRSKR